MFTIKDLVLSIISDYASNIEQRHITYSWIDECKLVLQIDNLEIEFRIINSKLRLIHYDISATAYIDNEMALNI